MSLMRDRNLNGRVTVGAHAWEDGVPMVTSKDAREIAACRYQTPPGHASPLASAGIVRSDDPRLLRSVLTIGPSGRSELSPRPTRAASRRGTLDGAETDRKE